MDESATEVAVPGGALPAAVAAPATAAVTAMACVNCGTPVLGRYCGNCGQRLDTHLHSLGEFFAEATEVLTHADSRVWATLRPLLTKPGFLTREYLAGRRARYLQPFRLYLVLSVLFFLLVALLDEGAPGTVAVAPQVDVTSKCANLHTDLPGADWVKPRFVVACRSMLADNGRQFSGRVVHNFGRTMFVFLPLLAALMKLLYWRPRRYYLEHLLLLLHNHAFVFLLLSIFMLAVHWLQSEGWNTLLSLGLTWYLGRYLYRSMRTVYGQNGPLTFLKFLVVGFAYLVGGVFMLIATALVSAATL